MKETIVVFKQNRAIVESFLRSTIELNSIDICDEHNYKKLFTLFPSLELVYMVDGEFKQRSNYFYKNRIDDSTLGLTKGHLFNKVQIRKDALFVSNPYISSHTGRPCITIVKPIGEGYIVFDFNLLSVLSQLKLIEINRPFDGISRLVYGIIGFGLMVFSIFLAIYGGYIFIVDIGSGGLNDIKTMFTPIIALTLGLAIFDLSKTVLEQEVFYKNNIISEGLEGRVLTKFLISIIIALSIEALMVVFKIALSDYSKMENALFLILGIALLILSLGLYQFFSKKAECMRGEG